MHRLPSSSSPGPAGRPHLPRHPPLPPPGVPVARFSSTPPSPDVNTAVSFDGSTSTSSNGALQARWDWEDNGVWDTTLSTTLSATHAFPSAGSYSIRLEVRDAGGLTGTVTHPVSVAAAGSPGVPGAPTTSVGVDGVVSTNGWHMSAVNVTMSATSPSGSSMVTLYSLDSAAWTTYAGPFAVQGGNHTLHWQSRCRGTHRVDEV